MRISLRENPSMEQETGASSPLTGSGEGRARDCSVSQRSFRNQECLRPEIREKSLLERFWGDSRQHRRSSEDTPPSYIGFPPLDHHSTEHNISSSWDQGPHLQWNTDRISSYPDAYDFFGTGGGRVYAQQGMFFVVAGQRSRSR